MVIKNVLLEGKRRDIHISGETIDDIFPAGECHEEFGDTIIDGTNKAVIPGMINMHTHAAMTLFRGYADDMPLQLWLETKIWPKESKLTEDDVYWGTKLACLEMIKSGTTMFFDMYYHFDAIAQAVKEMGLRAFLSEPCFDFFDAEKAEKCKKRIKESFVRYCNSDDIKNNIKFALGPHAIYSVSGEMLKWVHDFARENDLFVQMHLAETEQEVANCKEKFGTTPVKYLHELGILSPRMILAHALYVDDDEVTMLADSGASVVHNPASNMKLASGYKFKYKEMKGAGVKVALGTDGCASSNNLDMIEAMRLASFLGKAWRKDAEALKCDEMLVTATKTGSDILGIKAGTIEKGMFADMCLIDVNSPIFTPNHNFVSNLVYSANGSCVDTVICNGQILMANKKVQGEEEILEQAAQRAQNLMT